MLASGFVANPQLIGPSRNSWAQRDAELSFSTPGPSPSTAVIADALIMRGILRVMTPAITGVHAVIFTRDAGALRAFLRDVLELDSVDAGGGWPIFALPPAELAAHPSDEEGRHELYLMCDDIEATVARLEAKGVEFAAPVTDEGWGLVTAIGLPGGGSLGLYEPRHPSPVRPKE